MSEHYYTEADRRSQLTALRAALLELIPAAESARVPQLAAYQAALSETDRLLASGFTPEDLKSLSRMVPDVIPRYRDWESQLLIQNPQGEWVFPTWFATLEPKLRPVLEAAAMLGFVGYR